MSRKTCPPGHCKPMGRECARSEPCAGGVGPSERDPRVRRKGRSGLSSRCTPSASAAARPTRRPRRRLRVLVLLRHGLRDPVKGPGSTVRPRRVLVTNVDSRPRPSSAGCARPSRARAPRSARTPRPHWHAIQRSHTSLRLRIRHLDVRGQPDLARQRVGRLRGTEDLHAPTHLLSARHLDRALNDHVAMRRRHCPFPGGGGQFSASSSTTHPHARAQPRAAARTPVEKAPVSTSLGVVTPGCRSGTARRARAARSPPSQPQRAG